MGSQELNLFQFSVQEVRSTQSAGLIRAKDAPVFGKTKMESNLVPQKNAELVAIVEKVSLRIHSHSGGQSLWRPKDVESTLRVNF